MRLKLPAAQLATVAEAGTSCTATATRDRGEDEHRVNDRFFCYFDKNKYECECV